MPANKGQTLPTTLRTPLNYSEILRSSARDLNLNPELAEKAGSTPKIDSLLMDINSLFSKNISLILELKFPVNFRPNIPKNNESPMNTGRLSYTYRKI